MASDLGGVSSLATAQQHTSSSIATLDARLKQLEGYSKDYEVLQKKLTQLSQKTKHEIMVPLGPLAFQPGFLHHTNELTVLLGENYFVERSTSQAVDIIKRRLEYLDKQKQNVNKQLGNTKQIDTSSRQMFGDTTNISTAKSTTSSSSKPSQQPAAPSAATKKAGVDTSLPSELGITFTPDGKMRNEDGDEIVEIKEDYVEEDEVEQKSHSKTSDSASSSSAAASSTSSSFSLTPSSHPASSSKISLDGPIDFPSVLDQNFDDFWDSLEAMEKKQEAEEAAAAASSTPAASSAAREEEQKSSSSSSASASSTDDAADTEALRELLPVPSPPLRPISNPADIFRAITEAKLKAGEIIPPTAKPTSSTTASTASRSSSTAASSSSSAIETSRAMDAAFADYKSAKKAKKKATGGAKRVAFAEDDSDSEPEIDKGAPIPQSHSPSRPTSILKKTNPAPTAAVKQTTPSTMQAKAAEASTERPVPFSSTPGAVAAFSGEIKERNAAAAADPVVIEKPAASAFPKPASSMPRPLAGPRPLTTPASSNAAAAPQKLSKFKAKMLGLSTDDD